jgi:threonine aldolase
VNDIDIRSDTVTQPTQEMREALYRAEVGDDVYGEDPTVRLLEEKGADILGMEAALLVPSGTFGNQLALFTHCRRGNEVILGEESHIVQHEVGAAAVISQVQLRTIYSRDAVLKAEEIRKRLRKESDDIHYPGTGLICLENALSNGRVVPLASMDEVRKTAKEFGIPIHLDGARIFNAAAVLGVEAKEIAVKVDSVMFCLSKGLCAPIGSLLAGSVSFIAEARKKRKLMGGGMRQAGFIAAAGIVALDKMRARLPEDHENARRLARLLAGIPGIKIDLESVQINMVFFAVEKRISPDKIVERFRSEGIKINPPEGSIFRFVTNYWVRGPDIERIAATMRKALEKD